MLEILFQQGSLELTGKNYTFDSVDLIDFDTSFKPTSYPEYRLSGYGKYIRVLGRGSAFLSSVSKGKALVQKGKPYWLEVKPIEWLKDESGWMVAKKCLFAGIQFDTKKEYNGDFSKTSIAGYLRDYFDYEMLPTDEYLKVKGSVKTQAEKDKTEKSAERLNGRLKDGSASKGLSWKGWGKTPNE